MFERLLRARRRSGDANDSREPRFHRTVPQSQNSSPSPPAPDHNRFTARAKSSPLVSDDTSNTLRPGGESEELRRNSDSSRRPSNADPGPLGLNVVYSPKNGHKVDIVFVHGLGGTSRWTWSKFRDPTLFWPMEFLPLEPDACHARILTFGYDANFRRAGSAGISILDFAKDLLFDLKYATDEENENLNIGNVPLVFVVHSMGGLVIKEAYMQGQNDPLYESIIKAIAAIAFLATPHRGANLAEMLNWILQSSLITNSKQYISELAKNSFSLQKLNEQFRHVAPKLDIVSFYETQPTSLLLKKPSVMILEKDSSILGYPGEISKALHADHHNVCKYDSPTDPNYIIVRNALKSLIGKLIVKTSAEKPPTMSRRRSQDLKSLLAIIDLPDIDYIFFRDQWNQGTCEWILQEKSYLDWKSTLDLAPQVLWLSGGPAAGKSVLSSFVINSLVEQGACCLYFFIRFGDQRKRSLSFILRSIAYQLARTDPVFLGKVLELADEGIDFETADPRTIWERIFRGIVFSMRREEPLYWVIDGLDEATDPRTIIKQLSDLPFTGTSIRVLLVGRKTSEISSAFQKVPTKFHVSSISIDGRVDDLRAYVRQELSMSGSPEYQETVIQRLLGGAQNNFLWIRLAVDRLNSCHSEADVELALLKLPEGMEALYDRMGTGIARTSSPKDLAFTTTVLQTVTCSLRILSLAELSQAMGEDASRMLNFQRSVVDLCRGFVVIDNGGNVAMIHQTAREYLLGGGDRPFKIERDVAHKQLFASCMRALTSSGLRAKIQGNQTPDFLNYAASSWSSHLVSSPVGDEDTVGLLNKFLTGNWVLTWIHFLAHSGKLRILVRASQHLSKYFSRRRENISSMDEEGHQFIKHELLQNWAIDFLKIVGKFGASLRRDPMAIYKAIPPFCPRNSSIYQLFGKTEARHIAISGLSTELWDDSLARISLGTGIYASSIAAAGCQIAILVSSGTVFIYDSTTFEEAPSSPIQHGERLFRMELNSNGTLLSTYGYRTTKVWDIPTGKCRLAVDNIESRPRPLSILWTNDNTRLLVGTDDRRVRALDLTEASPTWQLVAELEEPELEGHFLNSSSYMAFNKDGTLVAVAYRGHPMSAWEIDGPSHIAHCWRKREKVTAGQVIQAVWHPHTPELLGLYIEGIIFKWRPYEGEVEELATNASRLSMSRDGNLFATGDVRGAVKVYTTSDLGLLYQLTSEDNVLSLTFSPDMRRLYDLRGYYANAWEPDALIKYADQRGKDQDVGSERGSLAPSLGTSLNPSKRIDAVTVLAHSPNGFLYCCGTENGNVRLYDTRQQFPSDVYKSKGFLSVENMCWSPDGRYLCLSDSGKKVMIVAITSQPGGAEQAVHQIKGEVSMRAVTTGPILQLLFHPDSSQLCVHSSSRIHVISLATFSVTQSLDLAATETKWITHPQDANLLIGIGPGTICVLDWSFGHHRNYRFECAWEPTALEKQDGLQPQLGVDRVLGTADKKHVLVQISRRTGNSRDKSLLCFDAPSLSVSTVSTPATDAGQDVLSITPITLAHDLSSEVGMCLYFLPQNRLVFLSKSFSVCTARISATQIGTGAPILPPGGMHRQERTTTARNPLMNAQSGHAAESPALKSMRRLFSLPGDWINKDSMLLSSIWAAERSFMCPKNGEVAVVRCAELA